MSASRRGRPTMKCNLAVKCYKKLGMRERLPGSDGTPFRGLGFRNERQQLPADLGRNLGVRPRRWNHLHVVDSAVQIVEEGDARLAIRQVPANIVTAANQKFAIEIVGQCREQPFAVSPPMWDRQGSFLSRRARTL